MKRYLSAIILSLILITGVPHSAYAVGMATGVDPVQALKEWGIDTVGWFLGGLMTGNLTRSTADWVNSGFGALARTVSTDAEGNPITTTTYAEGGTSFVINPQAFFQNLSEGAAFTFYDQLVGGDGEGALDTLLPGFKQDLLSEIQKETQGITGNFFDDFKSSLNDDEVSRYLNDFSQGGWDTFLKTTQVCANNYSCTRLAVLGELRSRTTEATEQAKAELQQGGGFLTMRRCTRNISELAPEDRAGISADPMGCISYENVTPGKLLGEQITKGTNIEFDRTAQADELTEVISLLLEKALNTLIDTGLSELGKQLSIDYSKPGGVRDQSKERAEEIDRNNERLKGDLKRGTGKKQEICEPLGEVKEGEEQPVDSICADTNEVLFSEDLLSNTIKISHTGASFDEAVVVNVEGDFEPYAGRISVTPSRITFAKDQNTSRDLKIQITGIGLYSGLSPEAKAALRKLSGTITVGPLTIKLVGDNSEDNATTASDKLPGCVDVEGGTLCAMSTEVSMFAKKDGNGNDVGASGIISLKNSGTSTFEANIMKDFSVGGNNFSDKVLVSSAGRPDRVSISRGGTAQVSLLILPEDTRSINFNDFRGTITIGDLVIKVLGVDLR